MSTSQTPTLWCDDDQCSNWEHGEENTTPTQMRALLKRRGWLRRGGKDLCPECARSSDPS